MRLRAKSRQSDGKIIDRV